MIRERLLQSLFLSLSTLDSVVSQSSTEYLHKSEEFKLFGEDASLDSLDLVTVITDLEEFITDELGFAVSLTDDAALLREISPFTSVRTLLDYCEELIRDLER